MEAQTVRYNNREYQIIRINESDSSLDISLSGTDVINCKQEDVVFMNPPEPVVEDVRSELASDLSTVREAASKSTSRKTPKI